MHFHNMHASLPITQILLPCFRTITVATVPFFRLGCQNDTLGMVLCLEADSVKLSSLDAVENSYASRAIYLYPNPPPGTTLNGTLSYESDITDNPGDMFGVFGRSENVLIVYKKGTHQDISGRLEYAAIEFSMQVDIVGDGKEFFYEDKENHTFDTCSTFLLSEHIRQEEFWEFANTEAMPTVMDAP